MLGTLSQTTDPVTGRVIASRGVCRALERHDMLPRDFLLAHIAAVETGKADSTTTHRLPDGTRVTITTNVDRTLTEIRLIPEER